MWYSTTFSSASMPLPPGSGMMRWEGVADDADAELVLRIGRLPLGAVEDDVADGHVAVELSLHVAVELSLHVAVELSLQLNPGYR
jgi:hypothetical protein